MAAKNDSQTTNGHFATQKFTSPALIPSPSGTHVSISAQTKATSEKTLPSQPAVDDTSTLSQIPFTASYLTATSNNAGGTSSSTTIQVIRSLFSHVPSTLKSSVHTNSVLASTGSTSATFTSVLGPPTNALTTSASQSKYFHIASTPSQTFLQTSLLPSGKTNTSNNITAIQTNTGHKLSPFSVSSISNFGHGNTSVEKRPHSSTSSGFTHSAIVLSSNSASSRFPFRPHESHNMTSSTSAKSKIALASLITSSRSSSVNRSHQFTSSKFVQSTVIPTTFFRPIPILPSTKSSSTRSSVSSEATHPPVSSHTITSAPPGRTTHTSSDHPCIPVPTPFHLSPLSHLLPFCGSSSTSQRGTSATESRKSSALSKTTFSKTTFTHVLPSKPVFSSLLSHHTERSSTSTQRHLTSSGNTHRTTSTHSTSSSHTQTHSPQKQTTTQSKKTSSPTHSHTTSPTTVHSVPSLKPPSINTSRKTPPTSTLKSANIDTATTNFQETPTTTTSSGTQTITTSPVTSLTPFILSSSNPSLSPTTTSSIIIISFSASISSSSSSSFTTSSIAPTHTTFPTIHLSTHVSSYSTSRHTFSIAPFTTDPDTVATPWPKVYSFDNQTVHPQSLAGLTIGLSVFLYLLITVGVIIVLHVRHRRAEARTFRYVNLRV